MRAPLNSVCKRNEAIKSRVVHVHLDYVICPLVFIGSGSDPAAEGDHGDSESPHEAATGAASQGG